MKKYVYLILFNFLIINNVFAFSFDDFFIKIGFISENKNLNKKEIKTITLPNNYEQQNQDVIKNYYITEIEKKEIIISGTTTDKATLTTATTTKSFQDIINNLKNFLTNLGFGISNKTNTSITSNGTGTTLGNSNNAESQRTSPVSNTPNNSNTQNSNGQNSRNQFADNSKSGSEQNPLQDLITRNSQDYSPISPISEILQGPLREIINKGIISGNAQGAIGRGAATVFSHLQNNSGICYLDDQDNGKSSDGFVLSSSGQPPIPAVALPQDVQTRIFGSYKDSKGRLVGAGTAVQVIYKGVCKVFPLYDTGPGAGPVAKGVVIDLTGSAFDIMQGKQPCKVVLGPPKRSSGRLENVSYAVFKDKKMRPGEIAECANY